MVMTSDLNISSADGHAFGCYVAAPDVGTPLPGIVLIQEIFGINANMRWTAQRFAGAGFLVGAPDLFWRIAPGVQLDPADPQQRARAMELNGAFNMETGISDCRKTIDQLRRHASCNGHVGTIGYCLGGRLAFLLATHGDVDAGGCFYPVAIQAELKNLTVSDVPLLVHLGSDDALCKADSQSEIGKFVESQKANRVVIYPGVGHGFARLGRSGDAAVAAEDAERTTIEFLRANL
jgi:carboxymethylenebutenolidase